MFGDSPAMFCLRYQLALCELHLKIVYQKQNKTKKSHRNSETVFIFCLKQPLSPPGPHHSSSLTLGGGTLSGLPSRPRSDCDCHTHTRVLKDVYVESDQARSQDFKYEW